MTDSSAGLGGWTGAELAASGRHLVELDSGDVARLVRSLPTRFVVPETPDAEAAFRATVVSALAPVAAEITARLDPPGPGLALVTGAALAGLTDEQLRALLFGLSVVLGRPIGQTAEDDRIVEVIDERPADVTTSRGYRTNSHMLMHTDPTDMASLLCLQQSSAGGGSLLASADAILDRLTERAPALVHQYFRLWDWDLRGVQRPDAPQIVPTPIFSLYRGVLSCRYGSLMLRDGARKGGELSAADRELFDLFEEVAQLPELSIGHRLRRGESLWLNNYRVLHGREAFTDDGDSGQVRHLLRTWVWRHRRPRLAPSFRAFAEAIDRGGVLAEDGESLAPAHAGAART